MLQSQPEQPTIRVGHTIGNSEDEVGEQMQRPALVVH